MIKMGLWGKKRKDGTDGFCLNIAINFRALQEDKEGLYWNVAFYLLLRKISCAKQKLLEDKHSEMSNKRQHIVLSLQRPQTKAFTNLLGAPFEKNNEDNISCLALSTVDFHLTIMVLPKA